MGEVPQAETVRVKTDKIKMIRNCSVLILALLFGYLHYTFVQTIHENRFQFSHLSELERELTLYSECGFYYSYFKTAVQERPFIGGITKIMYDRLVEYPKVVNAFSRFSIHPEVFLGATYHYLEEFLNTYRVCHVVNRGPDVPVVKSCVGIGEPIMFYLQALWLLAGLLVAVVFLFATELSGGILGGIIAVLQYFGNHEDCTRVMWLPNLRENFGAPLLFLQMYLVSLQLREDKKSKTSFRLQIAIFILNCLCLLSWQYSQFIFLTQTVIFFVMEQLKIIDLKTFCVFLHAHFCGLHMVLLVQGNDLLKTSVYTSFFLVVSCYCLFFSTLRVKVQTKMDLLGECWLIFLRIGIVIISTIHVKKILNELFGVEEDNHIWDLLFSKFSDFKSFHTLLYTCVDAFDFLPLHYFFNVSTTSLLPLVVYGIINVVTYWVSNGVNAVNVFETTKKTKILKKRAIEHKDDKMAANNKMADCKNGVEDTDTDDSGIENSECLNNSKNNLDIFYSDKPKEPELPVQSFIYFLKNLNVDPVIFYNLSQLVVFGLLAGLFMRLKMFLSTQLCIVCAIAWNPKYERIPDYDRVVESMGVPRFVRKILRPGILIISLLSLTVQGYSNITKEVESRYVFSDIEGEGLMTWIIQKTPPNAVFAGPLPVLASVMLTTRRPIVTHPHYENKDNRDRAYAVYKVYGRFSPLELYQELTQLEVAYLIVNKGYCYTDFGKRENCYSYTNMWDAVQPSYAGRPKLCKTILEEKNLDHFYRVYDNKKYAVFRVHDMSLLYMPRVFDT